MGQNNIKPMPCYQCGQTRRNVLFNLYLHGLSRELEECKTGSMMENQVIKYLMNADNLLIMSPCSAGLQQLLRVCTKYVVQFYIKFNPQKSVVMIARTKDALKYWNQHVFVF